MMTSIVCPPLTADLSPEVDVNCEYIVPNYISAIKQGLMQIDLDRLSISE